jgi:hypothetical protein
VTGGRRAPLDHREQQVGVGVALRRVQHVVQARIAVATRIAPTCGGPS